MLASERLYTTRDRQVHRHRLDDYGLETATRRDVACPTGRVLIVGAGQRGQRGRRLGGAVRARKTGKFSRTGAMLTAGYRFSPRPCCRRARAHLRRQRRNGPIYSLRCTIPRPASSGAAGTVGPKDGFYTSAPAGRRPRPDIRGGYGPRRPPRPPAYLANMRAVRPSATGKVSRRDRWRAGRLAHSATHAYRRPSPGSRRRRRLGWCRPRRTSRRPSYTATVAARRRPVAVPAELRFTPRWSGASGVEADDNMLVVESRAIVLQRDGEERRLKERAGPARDRSAGGQGGIVQMWTSHRQEWHHRRGWSAWTGRRLRCRSERPRLRLELAGGASQPVLRRGTQSQVSGARLADMNTCVTPAQAYGQTQSRLG